MRIFKVPFWTLSSVGTTKKEEPRKQRALLLFLSRMPIVRTCCGWFRCKSLWQDTRVGRRRTSRTGTNLKKVRYGYILFSIYSILCLQYRAATGRAIVYKCCQSGVYNALVSMTNNVWVEKRQSEHELSLLRCCLAGKPPIKASKATHAVTLPTKLVCNQDRIYQPSRRTLTYLLTLLYLLPAKPFFTFRSKRLQPDAPLPSIFKHSCLVRLDDVLLSILQPELANSIRCPILLAACL
jgi:hypothetical protein